MNISTRLTITKAISSFIGMMLFSAPPTAFAQDSGFYVIPVAQKLKNVVTVAKANGNFTDPVAAVNTITDASMFNPYLVVIGPGVYSITETLEMKADVDIVGSGENVTKITGAISTGAENATSAIISCSYVSRASLSSLTVENTGGDHYSTTLYNRYASPKLRNVTLKASGGTVNHSVLNYSANPEMTHVSITVSGGTTNTGVVNHHYSSPTMTHVTVEVSDGTESNVGVASNNSSPEMTDVKITARGTSSTGVYAYDGSSNEIRRSTITGDSYSIHTGSEGKNNISQSTLCGEVRAIVGVTQCVACDNGDGKALNENCQPIP